jgi:hypothetical protein
VVPWLFPESGLFTERASLALDTVRCTPDSPVHHRLVQVWLDLAKLLQFIFLDLRRSLALNIQNKMCLASNHQNNTEMAQRHISLLISPFLVIHANTSKATQNATTYPSAS